MTEWLLNYLPDYGLSFMALVIGLGCLGVPLPASLLLLMAGTLVASGELGFAVTFCTCLGAAAIGDHIGYFLGS